MTVISTIFNKNIRKSNIAICILLSAILSVFQIVGKYLDFHSTNTPFSTGSLLVSGIAWFIFFNLFLLFLWKLGIIISESKPFSKGIFEKSLFWQLIILISWLPCYLAYFPGIYSYDGEPQLIQYTTGCFDNHHPILHTLIIGGCYDLGQRLSASGINIDGLAFYTTLQVLLLSYAFSYMLMFLVKKGVGKIYVNLSAAYICLFPVTPLMAVSSTKDTFFTAFFILFLTQLAAVLDKKSEPLKSELSKLLAFSAGCMFFRRNGLYVILLLCIFCALAIINVLLKGKRRFKEVTDINIYMKRISVFVALLISVILFCACEKIMINVLNAEKGESAEALSIPLQQMARAYKSNDAQVRSEYGDRLNMYISETGLSNYRPLITDGVKQYFNNDYFAQNKKDFVKLYIDMGKSYPGPYILGFLYLTKGDYQIFDTSFCEVYKDWWRDRTGYLITDATPVFAQRFVNKSDLLPGVQTLYERFATECTFMKYPPMQFIFSPALYVWLTVLGTLAILIKRKKKFYPLAIALMLYLLTMIAGPCVLIRYVFPLMASMPLFAWSVFRK